MDTVDRQSADSAFGEVLRLDPEGVIKSGAVILPGYGRCQLYHFRIAEPEVQFGKKVIRYLYRRSGHGVCILQDELLHIAVHLASLVVCQLQNFLRCNAALSADRRPDIDSKRAPHQRRNPKAREALQTLVYTPAAEQRLLHLPVAP